jgi:hypothetical protein
LEDGRVFGASNGIFDAIVELVASELARRADSLPGLADWLLEQRCGVQGPGIGYLVVREFAPRGAPEVLERASGQRGAVSAAVHC